MVWPRENDAEHFAGRGPGGVVWLDSPEQTLSNPQLFLAHLMVYGTLEEVLAVKQHFTNRDFQNVLDNPPAGIFDPRSWAYWNLLFGIQPPTPLPVARRFPASDDSTPG